MKATGAEYFFRYWRLVHDGLEVIARAVPFYQGHTASGNAGRVRFAGRGEEIEKAQMDPVRTGEKHRRAHIQPVNGWRKPPVCSL